AQASVGSIASDGQGRLWVGTEQQGLFVLDLGPRLQIRSLHRVKLGNKGPVNYPLLSLVTAPDGQVWLGTLGTGLWVLRAEPALPLQPVATQAPFAFATVRCLHLDRRGDLWLGTNRQIFWVSRQDRLGLRHLA